MKRNPVLLTVLTLFFQGLATFAQQPSATPPPITSAPQTVTPAADDDDVVRITTNLIQFDVTVTDHDGHPIPDLRPEDFEILENNKTQTISNFSYIALAPNEALAPKAADKYAPPIPMAKLRPEQVRRTIALVVDDLGLSFESIAYTRTALRKFVDTQMQPGDLVAIVRTGGGLKGLQQFTSDKRQLYATIDRIQWRIGRSRISAFAPATGDDQETKLIAPISNDPSKSNTPAGLSQAGGGTLSSALAKSKTNDVASDPNEFRGDYFTVGTLGSLNFIVQGLRELPGRKSVVLITDGFRLIRQDGNEFASTFDLIRRLTDLANRSAVVIYTIDPRGLMIFSPTAEDSITNATQVDSIRSNRALEAWQTQSGPAFLAQQTGGFAVHNDNDIAGALKRIINDQNGYYLIGYHPDETTFDPHHLKYNNFTVKLKRKGLELRYRTGFYGVTDDRVKVAPQLTRPQMMRLALVSPFSAGGADLQLTSLFGNDAKTGSYVRSFLHIRAQDLTFKEVADRRHQADFDLLAVTFGKDDLPIDQVSRTYTIDLSDEVYQRVLATGLVYVATVPVKKAGAYQLRVAVRDVGSSRIGSASQFIEVPEFKNKHLSLSGLAAFGSDPATLGKQPAGNLQFNDLARSEEDPEAGVALRRLRVGMILRYACFLYNATIDKTSGLPQLQTQVRIFRDGREVYAGDPKPYDAAGQADLQRLPLAGALSLGTVLSPGQYVLQVVVTDNLATDKHRTVTQWIDFEIVPPANPEN